MKFRGARMRWSTELGEVDSTDHQLMMQVKEKGETNRLYQPRLVFAYTSRAVARVIRPDAGCCSLAVDVVGRQHRVSGSSSTSMVLVAAGVCWVVRNW